MGWRRALRRFGGRQGAAVVSGPVKLIDFAAEGTFARTTEASVFNPASGALTCYGVNELRPGLTLAYTLEGAGDNLAKADSNAFDQNPPWVRAGTTVTANTVNDPEGNLAADSVAYVGAGNTLVRSYTAANTNQHTLSLFARADAASAFRLRHQTTGSDKAVGTTWARYTDTRAGIVAAQDAGTQNETAGGAKTIYHAFAQLEESPFVTSYMCDSSGTRGADDWTLPIGALTVLDTKRSYIDVIPEWPSTVTGKVAFIISGAGTEGYLRLNTTAGTKINWYIGGTLRSIDATWNAGDKLRIYMEPANGELRVEKNGVHVGTVYGEAATWGAAFSYQIGSLRGTLTQTFDGEISDIYEVPVADGDPLLDYTEASVTRASLAWWLDNRSASPGTYIEASSGEARIAADGAVMVEGARTNYAYASPPDAANAVAMTYNGTSTDVPAAGMPDSFDGTFTGGTSRVQRVIGSVTNSVPVRAFAWVKSKNPGQHENIRLRLLRSDGTYDTDVNVTTTDEWQKIEDPGWVNSATGTGNVVFYVYSNNIAGVNGNPFLVSLWQCETNVQFSSQPIEATSGTAARAADAISFATAPYLMRADVWEFDYWPGADSDDYLGGDDIVLFNLGGSNADRIYIITGVSQNNTRVREAGVDIITGDPITWSAGQKITFRVDCTAGTITVSGATTGNGTFAKGSAFSFPAGLVNVGNINSGTAYAFGAISQPRRVIP